MAEFDDLIPQNEFADLIPAASGNATAPASQPTLSLAQIGRALALGGRDVLTGAYGMVAPFADLTGYTLNKAQQAFGRPGVPPIYQFETNHSQNLSNLMDQAGLPKPETTPEKIGSFLTQFETGAALGGPLNRAIVGGFGLTVPGESSAAIETARQRAVGAAPGADVLTNAGVPLDRAQRSGSTFLQRVRSALGDNPITAGAQERFTDTQNQAYTRAVMSRIGVNSDQANRPAMLSAKEGLGEVFDFVAAKSPAVFDDTLQNSIAQRMESAGRTLKPDEFSLLKKNVDYILQGVQDNSGRIDGQVFKRALSDLGELTGRQDIGQVARGLQDDLLSSLERSAPAGSRELLQRARQAWRSMRIIEPAIDKGVDKYISPLRLSNAVASVRNRAMSIYGQGGDQGLVDLAEAGRELLPQQLPQSGTVPRGLMAAPLRALMTAPLYKGAQLWMNSQPSFAPAGPSIAPQVAGGVPSIYDWLRQQAAQ